MVETNLIRVIGRNREAKFRVRVDGRRVARAVWSFRQTRNPPGRADAYRRRRVFELAAEGSGGPLTQTNAVEKPIAREVPIPESSYPVGPVPDCV